MLIKGPRKGQRGRKGKKADVKEGRDKKGTGMIRKSK